MEGVIFLVDDDEGSRDAMRRALERVGYDVRAFGSAEEALARLEAGDPVDVIVSDVRMPGMDGYDFLRAVRADHPDLPFLLVTAFGDVDDAVAALQEGADDYLTKPVKMQELRRRVQLHLERRSLSDENRRLRQRLEKSYGFEGIIGHSRPMEELYERMRIVAPAPSTVLIVGESGTGKELVANAIHQNSPRASGPFVPVNCGAIPGEILESELFGHERGAFTGAHQRRIGLIETASGGTLFLDEISELSPELQVKLLRVLEDRKIVRVGGSVNIPVDFRLVAATNRDLESWVEDGRFRQDLYYRLKVVTLEIPPLRQRPDDIPLLVQHFLALYNEKLGRSVRGIDPEALDALAQQPWPGNVRELRNLMETLVLFCRGDEITLEDLPPEYRVPGGGREPARSDAPWHPRPMADIEKEAILRTLEYTKGHRGKAAQLLQIGLRTLQRKLKEYGEISSG
ncbi:MAG TPA: sigma-54-dependent Fis family transcriptional regulator [Acidobacteria bacterium]|nr:sigma-54-dependent Fis family transcriptional regulator [Acidobacteriota bacterium]